MRLPRPRVWFRAQPWPRAPMPLARSTGLAIPCRRTRLSLRRCRAPRAPPLAMSRRPRRMPLLHPSPHRHRPRAAVRPRGLGLAHQMHKHGAALAELLDAPPPPPPPPLLSASSSSAGADDPDASVPAGTASVNAAGESVTMCGTCRKWIASANIGTHSLHCARNSVKCPTCAAVVKRCASGL